MSATTRETGRIRGENGESKAEQFWKFYKATISFPADHSGPTRYLGMTLYFLCISLTVAFLILMYRTSDSYFTKISVEYGNEIGSYRTPDVIICPKPTDCHLKVLYKYNVKYWYYGVWMFGMSPEQLNNLTKIKLDSCDNQSRCQQMNFPCENGLETFCTVLGLILSQFTEAEPPSIATDRYIYDLWVLNNRTTTLEMLWLFLLDSTYIKLPDNYDHSPIYCTSKDGPRIEECERASTTIWVDNSLCWLLPSVLINVEGKNDFINIRIKDSHYPEGIDFWMGNIDVQIPSLFFTIVITDPRHTTLEPHPMFTYTLVEYQSHSGKKCPKQYTLRGLKLNCENLSDKAITRYYDWTSGMISTGVASVALRISSKDSIEMKESFSSYTKFQFMSGLTSAITGHSVLQILYFIAEKLRKPLKTRRHTGILVFVSIYLLVLAMTAWLEYLDLSHYFGTRYNLNYKEIRESRPYPVIEFQTDRSEFLNMSKIRQHNISHEFYAYLRYASFQIDPVSCKSSKDPMKNFMLLKSSSNVLELIDYEFHRNVSEIIRSEANRVSYALGFNRGATLAELKNELTLDPNDIITNCRLGQSMFECGSYLEYFVSTENVVTISFILKNFEGARLLPKRLTSDGNSLAFSIDKNALANSYSRMESDFPYYGPNEERLNVSEPNYCNYLFGYWFMKILNPGTYTQVTEMLGFSIQYDSLPSQSFELSAQFDHRLSKRPENQCMNENEKQCAYPEEDKPVVLSAVQLEAWCGCLHCTQVGIRNSIYKVIRSIIGHEFTCCTTSQLTGCYTQYIERAKSFKGKYEPDNVWRVLISMHRPISLSSLDLALKNRSHTNWNDSDLSQILADYWEINESTKFRLKAILKTCFISPCKQFKYSASTTLKESADPRFIDITLYFKSSSTFGIEEEDRFNVSDMIGVLMCSFSFTFGFGIIGIVEFVLDILGVFSQSHKEAFNNIRQHLIRSLGFWTEKKEHKVNTAKNMRRRRKPIQNQIDPVTELRVENLESTESGERIYEQPPNSREIEYPFAVHPDESRPRCILGSKLNKLKNSIMLAVLLSSAVFMAFTLNGFFASAGRHEYKIEILNQPLYPPPSIILCAKGEKSFVLTMLNNSRCQGYQSKIFMSCSTFFKKVFTKTVREHCFLHEGLGERSLNPADADLAIEMPEWDLIFIELTFSIFGQDHTLEDSINPWKFDRSVVLSYRIRIEENQKECLPKVVSTEEFLTRNNLTEAHLGQQRHLSHFENASSKNYSHVDTCIQYQYYSDVFYSQFSRKDIRRLEIKPATDFAIKRISEPVFNSLTLFSMVGGIVGTFVEVTVFSVLTLVMLLFLACFEGIAKAKNFAVNF